MSLKLLRFFTWLWFASRLYVAWSHFYRFLWERKYVYAPLLKTFTSLDELGAYLKSKAPLYRHDTWQQLFDAISRPRRVQGVFDGAIKDDRGLDCDEYAIYAANVIEASMLPKSNLLMETENPRLLTVCWRKVTGELGGHNVCLVTLSSGKLAFMDYGPPRGHADKVQGVIAAVMSVYAPGGDVIGWQVATPSLKVLEVGNSI